MIFIEDALMTLRPGAQWALTGDTIDWHDTIQTEPTKEEIDTELVRLRAEYVTNQYQRDRVYPLLGEQLDMIFHAGLGGAEFQAEIQAVKDANPKPV
jgi:hypothetical protein